MESKFAFLANELRHAIGEAALKQPMYKIDILMFEAIRLDAFADVRFAELRNLYSQSEASPGSGWTTVNALHWLADNASRLGFPYGHSLPALPSIHNSVGFPSVKLVSPHIEALASLIESIAAIAPKSAVEMTVGKLIGLIRTIEADEDRGRSYRAKITKTPMYGSPETANFIAATRWEQSARETRNYVHAEPGAARVLAVCRDEFGDAQAATLERLRDRLSIRLDCEPAEVAAMSLEEFLKAWKSDAPVEELQHRTTAQPSPKPTYSANTLKLFPGGVPDNTDLVDLVVRLNTMKDSGKSLNEIAREFVDGDSRKAASLLSQIRRLKREGKVNF